MLESIRKIAHNPAFKIIFGVLILAFAVSGIAGMNFANNNNYAVKVGKAVITQEEIDKRFQQMLLSIGPQALQMSDEQLAAAGINKNQVVKNLVQGKIVAQEAADIGIVVGDNSIMKQIEKMPIFKGPDGNFSPETFKIFLEKNEHDRKFFEIRHEK